MSLNRDDIPSDLWNEIESEAQPFDAETAEQQAKLLAAPMKRFGVRYWRYDIDDAPVNDEQSKGTPWNYERANAILRRVLAVARNKHGGAWDGYVYEVKENG